MKLLPFVICVVVLAAGCAARQRDRFYLLDAQPAGVRESRTEFSRQVTLRVTVPSLIDRGEMVLTGGGGAGGGGASSAIAVVLDHERWAAPLADLVTATLGEDIERRRGDFVVLPRSADQADIPLAKVSVDIDRVTARLGEELSIEAHWRVTDAHTGKVILGRDTFTSAQRPQDYAQVAVALSTCIGLLADRLVKEIPTP
jgi:uncharacterized lipoprotein YmbA